MHPVLRYIASQFEVDTESNEDSGGIAVGRGHRQARKAERENRSLANLVETALAETLIGAAGDSETPILSVLEEDVSGIEAIDDRGRRDPAETARLRRLVKLGPPSRRK